MAQPVAYTRIYNFTDFSTNYPTLQQPGTQLDAEFNAIKTTTDQIRTNLALIQKDDGTLANASVGRDQLKTDVVSGIGTPAAWVASTVYTVRSSVISGSKWYWCNTSHTSQSTITPDLAKWTLIMDFSLIGNYLSFLTDVAVSSPASNDIFQYNGTQWANKTLAQVLNNLYTTKGDLVVRNSTVPQRVGVGTDGQYLQADSSQASGLKWSTLSSSASVATLSDVTLTSIATNDFLVKSAGNWVNQTVAQVLALLSPLSTKGDLMVRNSTVSTRLAVGANKTTIVADSAQAEGVKWEAVQQFVPFRIEGTLANQDYTLIGIMPFAGKITQTKAKLGAGTATVTFKINSTGLGGGAHSATTSTTTVNHSSSNTFAAGDVLKITVASVSSASDLDMIIQCEET